MQPYVTHRFRRCASETAQSLFAAQAHSCSQFLRHKLSVISLQKLNRAGFDVGHVVQEAGEFIVTFPAAYHMGFNHGWNWCALIS